VLPVRVLGKCGGYDSDILAGMRWAAGLSVPGEPGNPYPARVVNLSLGGEGACSAAYQEAVDEIVAAGTVIHPEMKPEEVTRLLQSTARPSPAVGSIGGSSTVPACAQPQYSLRGTPVDQGECYCTRSTCGAGMLDAGAALGGSGPAASRSVQPTDPVGKGAGDGAQPTNL
jgi:hypothetical protein